MSLHRSYRHGGPTSDIHDDRRTRTKDVGLRVWEDGRNGLSSSATSPNSSRPVLFQPHLTVHSRKHYQRGWETVRVWSVALGRCGASVRRDEVIAVGGHAIWSSPASTLRARDSAELCEHDEASRTAWRRSSSILDSRTCMSRRGQGTPFGRPAAGLDRGSSNDAPKRSSIIEAETTSRRVSTKRCRQQAVGERHEESHHFVSDEEDNHFKESLLNLAGPPVPVADGRRSGRCGTARCERRSRQRLHGH